MPKRFLGRRDSRCCTRSMQHTPREKLHCLKLNRPDSFLKKYGKKIRPKELVKEYLLNLFLGRHNYASVMLNHSRAYQTAYFGIKSSFLHNVFSLDTSKILGHNRASQVKKRVCPVNLGDIMISYTLHIVTACST